MSTYLLMNKNKMVLEFQSAHDSFSEDVVFKQTRRYDEHLPFGFKDISTWIESRKALKHNIHLRRLMEDLGCADNEGFLRLTHAVGINDTFWIKSIAENTAWEDVSLYQNQFSDVISKLAFEGLGLNGESFSPSSPELTCDGSFRKCFIKENKAGEYGNNIFLYKRGYDIGAGLEPYSEALASEIAKVISSNSVRYDICRLHDKIASRCNLFTNEHTGYASFHKVFPDDASFDTVRHSISDLGYEQEFRKMLVTDALTFNTDRHSGNYGFLFDTDSMRIKGFAPIFDLNLSLLSSVPESELGCVGDALYGLSPKLGNDFTRLGQVAINDTLRDKVKDIKDFTFKFRGDNVFPESRVQAIEHIVRQQAAALLSKNILYTKDVFISPKRIKEEQERLEVKKASDIATDFYGIIENDKYIKDTILSICDGSIIVENDNGIVVIDFLHNKTYLETGYIDANLSDDLKQIYTRLTYFLSQRNIASFELLPCNALADNKAMQ